MVDRCVCSNRLFAEVKTIIDKHELGSVDELRNIISFGSNCGLCVPYIELVIKTGKTEFEPINFEDNLQ